MNLNFGSSVLKREAKPLTDVTNQLKANGWRQTGSLGNRVVYLENSGMNITVIDGPMGTLVVPSGPIRGRVFGDSGLQLNRVSVIGAGSDSSESDDGQSQKARDRVNQIT